MTATDNDKPAALMPGQVVWIDPCDRRPQGIPYQVTIASVGRRWARCVESPQFREDDIDKNTLVRRNGDRAYFSPQDMQYARLLAEDWQMFRFLVAGAFTPPPGIARDDILRLTRLIKGETL